MLISKKRLHKLRQEAYELGINKGYDLAWQMRKVERDNRGFIIAGNIDQEDVLREANQIVKEEGF